jgi:hypothetical protein
LWGADFSKLTATILIAIGVILTAAGVTALNEFFAL